ncbi:MAG TPA: hypothetical protein PLW83_09690, partial [Deltaproteobacteria bacterium]|nr:hypothetical protein [Deltaproteobacteria bacterium]
EREYLVRTVHDAVDTVSLKGASAALKIEDLASDRVTLEGSLEIRSASLARMLDKSWGALVMAATAGNAIMDAIGRSMGDDLTRSVVFDAVGSEMADSALDWIMKVEGRRLMRYALGLSRRRYSSGYGDLSLQTQKIVYDLLGLGRIGIGITDSLMLVPEKSVTAIAAVVRFA